MRAVAGVSLDDLEGDAGLGVEVVVECLGFGGGKTGSRDCVEGCYAVFDEPRAGVAAETSETADDDLCTLWSK